MPDREARARAVYDHIDEEPRPAGRRRRQVADWGVGEELFDGMPGRRFDRRGSDHSIPRGGADDGRRTIVITDDDVRIEDPPPSDEFARRDDALEARRRHDEVWAGDEPFADAEPADKVWAGDEVWSGDEPFADEERGPAPGDAPASESFAAAAEAFEEGGRFAEGSSEPDGIVRGGVEGRRTVKIGGRPAEFYSPSTRRRPTRPVHERLGARPDRIAAWAFALGILLILIAVATANI
jgi:hypothetical protein